VSLLATCRYIASHPVNRQRKLSALLGFVRWQLGTRILDRDILIDWVEGTRVVVRRGETGLTGSVYCGLDEFADMAFVLHSVRPTDLFVDVGANVGSYTILACAARGAQGIAIEPVLGTFARLKQNLAVNGLTEQVVALNAGVADAEGELRFTVEQNCMNHVVLVPDPSENTTLVRVLPLDALIEPTKPTFLKVDVEGFEASVVAGAKRTLTNPWVKAVIMELNHSGKRYGFEDDSIVRQLAEHGFQSYSYDPFARQLTSMSGKSNSASNTLFVRDLEWMEARIREAKAFSVGPLTL